MRDWAGPISQVIFVSKFYWTAQEIESLLSFECVDAVFMAVMMVLFRAEVDGDAARLAREEEVWLCNIVDQLL
jgi:hypothetical protein